MRVLIIGSGDVYGKWSGRGGNYCVPHSIKDQYTNIVADTINTVTYIDNNVEVKPDFIIDILEHDWWIRLLKKCKKYDIIIDTISHIGPHIIKDIHGQRHYNDIFKTGCNALLNENGVFYGFCQNE